MKRTNGRSSGTAHSGLECVRPAQSREWTGLSTVRHKPVQHQAGPGPEDQEAQTPPSDCTCGRPGHLSYHQSTEELEGQSAVRQPLNFSGFPVEGDRSPGRNLVL